MQFNLLAKTLLLYISLVYLNASASDNNQVDDFDIVQNMKSSLTFGTFLNRKSPPNLNPFEDAERWPL